MILVSIHTTSHFPHIISGEYPPWPAQVKKGILIWLLLLLTTISVCGPWFVTVPGSWFFEKNKKQPRKHPTLVAMIFFWMFIYITVDFVIGKYNKAHYSDFFCSWKNLPFFQRFHHMCYKTLICDKYSQCIFNLTRNFMIKFMTHIILNFHILKSFHPFTLI